MATTEDRRETDSGIEVKPVYTARGRRARPSSSRRASSRSRAASTRTCTAAGRGRCASTRASPRPRRRTRASATCSSAARPGLSVAFDLPTQLGYDSDDPRALGEVGRTGVAIDSLADMELLLRRDPARRGLDVDDDQRAGGAAAAALRARRRGAGRRAASALRGTVQNDILKEYCARGNYIFPPRPSMRLTTDLFAYCAERLPRWNTISISGYHIREAGSTAVQELAFTLANGIAYCAGGGRRGPLAGRVRRAALVLLQRAQPLLRGGGEVPRGAAAVGADHARALRRDEPEGARAALPRADRRLDADRAAAREQRRARRRAGALGGLRRRAVAAHERLRRGARAADASARRGSRCARSRSSRTRPAGRTRPIRSAAPTSSRR